MRTLILGVIRGGPGWLMPFGEVWEECCRRADVPDEAQWIKEAESYEKKVLAKRA